MNHDKKRLSGSVLMGYCLGRLAQCGNDRPENVIEQLTTLSQVLDTEDMFGWAYVIEKLGGLRRGIAEGAVGSVEYGRVSLTVCRQIGQLVDDILEKVTEPKNKDHYIIVNENEVIGRLASLHRIDGSDCDMMIRETTRCLESGACRAAIVLAWCLTFDHVRQWIFSSKIKRLKYFNSVLTTRKRNSTQLHDPIKQYEDFNEHRERDILDIAYNAKLFTKQKHQVLINALTDRNHFAHPNSRGATLESAVGYVDNLYVNVLAHPDFTFAIRRKKV